MKSEKITVSLPAETIQIANEKFAAFGFGNRSEFINAAIREYVSRDILRQFSGELVSIYEKIERSEIKQMEQHLSKLFYKIAVEQAQLYLQSADKNVFSLQPAKRLGFDNESIPLAWSCVKFNLRGH